VAIVAEVADVGAALAVHHHVVAGPGRQRGEIGVQSWRPVLHPQQAAVEHGDDEQRAVRHPAEARGPLGDLQHGLGAAARIDRDDPLGVEVREPEAPVVPAGSLGERQPVEQGLEHG
jgi:hypothetical protein